MWGVLVSIYVSTREVEPVDATLLDGRDMQDSKHQSLLFVFGWHQFFLTSQQ